MEGKAVQSRYGNVLKYLIALVALVVLALPISAQANGLQEQTNGLQETYNPQTQISQEELAKIQEQEWSRQLVSYAQTLKGKRTGQCVVALRKYFGISRSEVQGLAKNTKINSPTGKVGAIVVFKKMSWAGHVGIQITPVDSQGNFQYFDSNGNWNKRGAIRTININDRRISGYRII